MKQQLPLFALLLFFLSVHAQTSWTGNGDGYSWDDPNNWDTFMEPQDGDDVIVDNGAVIYYGGPFTYGSLTLTNSANLLLEYDMYLYGDLDIDPTSILTSNVLGTYEEYYGKIFCDYFYFNGDVDLLFSSYVPMIGNSYQIIYGNFGSCGANSTDIVPDIQASGFETYLAVFCQSDGVYFEVTDINYTTAISWDGDAGDGNWNTASNWDPDGVPTGSDTVILNYEDYIYTSASGTTSAGKIIVGDNSELYIQGDMDMYSIINVNPDAGLYWLGGSLNKTDPNVSSFIRNRGYLIIDVGGSGTKTLENGFGISNEGDGFVDIYDSFNINDGYFTNYTFAYVSFNDPLTISYTSSGNHQITNYGKIGSMIFVDDPVIIDLPSVVNNGTTESMLGRLAFTDALTNNGELRGGAYYQLDDNLVVDGDITPLSNNFGSFRIPGDTGTLTFEGNLNTSSSATFNFAIDGVSSFDNIVVTNQADLFGDINVSLGYLPDNSAVFEIISTGNLMGCNLPAQVTTSYNGTPFTFDVMCSNNNVYLLGPSATLHTPDFNASDLSVYPNPASSHVTIDSAMPISGSWYLYNQIGQLVSHGEMDAIQETNINTSALQDGMYILQIKDTSNYTISIDKITVSQ